MPTDLLTLSNYQAEEVLLGSPKIRPSTSRSEFEGPQAVYALREVQALVSIETLLDLTILNSPFS